MTDPTSLLREQMSRAGLVCPDDISITDEVIRFRAGEDRDESGWYVLHQDPSGVVFGSYGCWRRGIKEPFCSKEKKDFSVERWIEIQNSINLSKQKAREKLAQIQSETAKRAQEIVADSMPLEGHGYLERKQVKAHGSLIEFPDGEHQGWLALPLVDETGQVQNLQKISVEGEKRFLSGGRVKGCYFELASPKKHRGPIIICEGMATGATCHEATDWPTVCAMFRGNLLDVAQSIRKQFPSRPILIAADNDQFTQGNPGLTDAQNAAKRVGGHVAFPVFPEPYLKDKPTDWNDFQRLAGLDEVKFWLRKAMPVVATPIGDLQIPPENDPSELIRNRFLCRGGAVLLTGPTGVGKSSLLMQMLALWSLGEPCFGLRPTGPIKSIIIQAENDDGDLAYMRDGVCRGLSFSEARRGLFFHRVHVHTSNGIVGEKFVSQVLSALLSVHEADLIVIDPVLAYLGGDAKEQEVVSAFLRVHLQPLLKQHNVGCIILHHTNKPKEKKGDALFGEMAYSGSGSAEFANWARGVLALQAASKHGMFCLHAGKRGARIGWRDENDQVSYQKLIAHSRDANTICWREADDDDVNEAANGRAREYSDDEVLAVLPDGGLLTHEWLEACEAKGVKVSESTLGRIQKRLQAADRVWKSPVNSKWQPNLKNR